MAMPRTIVDSRRGWDAGVETGIRENSGTANHVLIGTVGGLAGLALSGRFNKNYNVYSHSIFANNETIDILGQIWHKNFQNLKNDKKEQAKIDFRVYKHLTSERATRNDMLNAIKTYKKDINNFLGEMSNGKNANFLLLPESALKGASLSRGIVVDLRELDYFNMTQIDSLVKDKIDSHNIKLTQDEKELYNKRFFVLEEPGYSTVLDEVSSPWIEFIVQRFVNAFIRVGVDNITQQQIESTISKIIEEGEKGI
jgi:hypothetical protein